MAKTYFYEKLNGEIIVCEGIEAWDLHKKGFKQVGVSDGETYRKALTQPNPRLRILHNRVLTAQSSGSDIDDKILEEYETMTAKRREEIQTAFKLELEKARGNFEVPPNADFRMLDGSVQNNPSIKNPFM
jgi:hypothetical protein